MDSRESSGHALESSHSFNTWLSNVTESRINFLSNEVLNNTWENISALLSTWQMSRLGEMESEFGIRCLFEIWFNYGKDYLIDDMELCNATWDNNYCWPPVPAGTRITRPCSVALQNSHPKYAKFLQGDAIRECLENGTWSMGVKTNYEVCATSYETWVKNAESDRKIQNFVRYMVFIGSIFSLICLGVALGIFYGFRILWTQRTAVHVNLMLALVLRFFLLYIITEPFIFNRSTTYRDHDILCKSLMSLYLYSTVVSVMWMLVQGMYLNSKLTTNVLGLVSKKIFRFYYFLGWIFPALVVAVYLGVMIANRHPEQCWKGYPEMFEIWIILAPLILALALNAFFLLNILRIVMQKTRNPNSQSENSIFVSVAKATIILFPILGLNNLLLIYNPGGEYDKYYVSLNTFFGSTQGIFVAIVYCFNNSEVHQAICRAYNRFRVRRSVGKMRRENQCRSFQLTTVSEIVPQQDGVATESFFKREEI